MDSEYSNMKIDEPSMEDNSDSGFADEILVCGNEMEFSSVRISSLVNTNNDEKVEATGSTRPVNNIIAHYIDAGQEKIDKQDSALFSDNDEDDEDYDDDDEDDEEDEDDSSSDDSLEAWFQEQSNTHNADLELFFKTYNINVPAHIGLEVFRKMILGLTAARRPKLDLFSGFDNVVELIRQKKHIIVLTGAGVSVSCGIPDFRSKDGIYSRLSKEYPSLPDPQSMFDINYFKNDPRPFYKFARDIFPGQFEPSVSHKFIQLLEKNNKLLRNYTQNIDTLERISGIQKVIECHGSFATATCTKCSSKLDGSAIKKDIFEQKIPICSLCNPNMSSPRSADDELIKKLYEMGIMKPDIVFFGEGLAEQFHDSIESDCYKCDLLIVIGSSLKVRPVALIPSWVPKEIPQILINREYLSHLQFDCNLIGDSDVIINQLANRLGVEYNEIVRESELLKETDDNQYLTRNCEKIYYKKSTSDYIFPGAEILVDEECDDLLAETELEIEKECKDLFADADKIDKEKKIECDEPPQKKIKLDE